MEFGYQPLTPPFDHQAKAFAISARKRVFALFMDPGTGKSKIVIDTAAYLYEHKKITALLIVAPNDVDEQWIIQEIPRHLPKRITPTAVCWDAGRAKSQRQALELIQRPLPRRLAVLAMNHEAFATKRGRDIAAKFLKTYVVLMVIDEGHAIKSQKAARTRWLIRLGDNAFARRILTGTPITKTPLDLYTIFQFLDIRIIGFESYVAFKNKYADWVKEYVHRFDARSKKKVLQSYEVLQGFRNLDDLYSRIDPYIFRQAKEDCLDLPPKMYSILPVHLTEAQLALYDQVKKNSIVLLNKVEAGEAVTAIDLGALNLDGEDAQAEFIDRLQQSQGRISAQIKLVTMLRCRQIVGGFVTTDAGEVRCIEGKVINLPRIRVALTWLDGVMQGSTGKIMIWARFKAEMNALSELLTKAKIHHVLVNGDTKGAARRDAIAEFKDRDNSLRVMITHEQSMGVGMDFNMVNNMLFYSCSHSYYQRAQAEDRAHRIGQRGTVTITDLHAVEVEIDRTMAAARLQAEGFKNELMKWKLSDIL